MPSLGKERPLKRKKGETGFTFVEVCFALAIATGLAASLVSIFLGVKSVTMLARHEIEASEVMRGQVETLKATAFGAIINSTQTASYDAGPDGIFGTVDDMRGTLTVTVQDFLDMDGDGNTTETAIDVDGDTINDPSAAVPVRVSFSWREHLLGFTKTFSVFADTLIAS